VEWFGITVAAFMTDFWLRVHYGVCFIRLPLCPTTRPPPTHLHATLILKLVPTSSKALRTSLHGFLKLVVQNKANDLVHTLMGLDINSS